jgi:hypothetical protein
MYTVSLPPQQEKGHRLYTPVHYSNYARDLKHILSYNGIRSLKVQMDLFYGLYAQLEVKMRLFLRSMRRNYGAMQAVLWTLCSM